MSASSKLLIDEEPLQVIPSLAAKIGLHRATFMQQLHYWLRKKSAHIRDGRRWIYNTFEEWHEQFPFWSPEAIRKIVSQLRAKGLIETTDRYNDRRGDRTLWYTIDYEALDALFGTAEESTQPPDQPDKSTEQPENIPQLEPEKSTERYQRIPETNNRDSALQAGEAKASPPCKPKPKAEKPGAYANRRSAELIAEYEEQGHKFFKQTADEKEKLGSQFAAEFPDRGVDELNMALLFRVQKAAELIEGEYPSWATFRYCLRQVEQGWRPRARLSVVGGKKPREPWQEGLTPPGWMASLEAKMTGKA